MFFYFSQLLSVFRAVREKCLLRFPAQLIEKLLQGSWHFDPAVVLEGHIECFQHPVKAVGGLGDSFDHMFNLFPGRSMQAREQVQDGFLFLALDGKFLLVQHYSLSPLPVVRHLVVEDRDEGVFHRFDGATSHRGGSRRPRRCSPLSSWHRSASSAPLPMLVSGRKHSPLPGSQSPGPNPFHKWPPLSSLFQWPSARCESRPTAGFESADANGS